MAMSITWDYSTAANTYADRPPYAEGAVDAVLAIAGVRAGDRACDVGAGTGHLTEPLARRGLLVDAVEPNDQMRAAGQLRTAAIPGVRWSAARGEETGRPGAAYALVTFGSSFNVTDTALALAETARILRRGGWFACLWNHRDLDDPLQAAVEDVIRRHLPGYDYGSRRADQTPVIMASGLFHQPVYLEVGHSQRVQADAWLNAWHSHVTLARQAGEKFGVIVDQIGAVLRRYPASLQIPYLTRAYVARLRGRRA